MEGAVDLLAEAARIERAAEALADESRALTQVALDDSAEYRRALYHYQQVIRHRIANPLQIILGLSQALLRLPDITEDRRQEMLEMILDQAIVLGRESLFDAGQQGAEEDELRGMADR